MASGTSEKPELLPEEEHGVSLSGFSCGPGVISGPPLTGAAVALPGSVGFLPGSLPVLRRVRTEGNGA